MSKQITFDRLIRIITLAIVFIAVLALINYLSSVLLPFFIVILISLLLITYIPWLSMFLPRALGLA